MEVCGGQTHAIVRFGLDEMLPPQITLIHGPGCPVCVTPLEMIDKALAIASRPEVIFCSFGDMLRVPGSTKDLLTVKSEGGDVRIVYSPMDAVAAGRAASRTAGRLLRRGLRDDRAGQRHGRVPGGAAGSEELLRAGLPRPGAAGDHAVLSVAGEPGAGLLGRGTRLAITGIDEYRPIARRLPRPDRRRRLRAAGHLAGRAPLRRATRMRRAEVVNQYARCVRPEGNLPAMQKVREVFEPVARKWRGIGEIPASGLALRPAYREFDAERRFGVEGIVAAEPKECIAGEVLQGHRRPRECPAFGIACTPERPLGAPMVSAEGTCAAYYRYRRSAL